MKKYLISNLVYGDLYFKIFTQYHLRSVLDETNLPAIAPFHKLEYRIYTDTETKKKLEAHPNIKRLSKLATVNLVEFAWHDQDDKFKKRYSVLTETHKDAIAYALKENFDFVTAWVADLVVSRHFFPYILRHLGDAGGHDAVFVLPLRSAFESSAGYHDQINRAMEPEELFKVGFTHLHPLWLASEYQGHRFTRLPFSLLWSAPHGIMARSFSVTPIIFKPKPAMLEGRCMIDGDIPQHFTNPYWAENWTDAPVIGLEPLFCYYPTFHNTRASKFAIRKWSRTSLHPSQRKFLNRPLYYPDKKTVKLSWWTKLKALAVAKLISS